MMSNRLPDAASPFLPSADHAIRQLEHPLAHVKDALELGLQRRVGIRGNAPQLLQGVLPVLERCLQLLVAADIAHDGGKLKELPPFVEVGEDDL